MTTPHELLANVSEGLSALPGVTVYVGGVPGNVPTIPGTVPSQIRPYVVIWPGEEEDPTEMDLAETGQGFVWGFRLTVAARDANDVLGVAFHVRRILNRRDGPHGARYEQVPTGAVVSIDPDPSLKPSRSFLPMRFQAFVPH